MPISIIIQKGYDSIFTIEGTETIDDKKVSDFVKNNSQEHFLDALEYYLGILEDTKESALHLYDERRKRQLQMTLLLLSSQKWYEETHQKTENLKTYANHIERCKRLIQRLPKNPNDTNVKYLFIYYAHEFANNMVSLADRKTKTIKEAIGWFNEKRLYWIWGSSLLKTVVAQVPDTFYNQQDTANALRAPDPYTGTLSWALYYFRFSLNMFLLLKHTLGGPWMSQEEKHMPWTERFSTQFAQRKFTLLNDFMWANVNMVCFFWLNGKSGLGAAGDALTVVLLVFDLAITIWDAAEQETKYNKEMLGFQKSINTLKTEIKTITNDTSLTDMERSKKLSEIKIKMKDIEKAQTQCEANWSHQKFNLGLAIAYSSGLLFAFFLLTLPFLPVSAPTTVAIATVGAVLCFALTITYNAIKSGAEIYKAHTNQKGAASEYNEKLKQFKSNKLTDNEKKLLYLEIMQLQANNEYQHKMVIYQTMHFFRSVFIESMTPAIIFASFMFLPVGAAFGILGIGLSSAVGSHLFTELGFKPAKGKAKDFDEAEYKEFYKTHTKKGPKFFQGVSAGEHDLENDDDLKLSPL